MKSIFPSIARESQVSLLPDPKMVSMILKKLPDNNLTHQPTYGKQHALIPSKLGKKRENQQLILLHTHATNEIAINHFTLSQMVLVFFPK